MDTISYVLFPLQVPMTPLQRHEEMHSPSDSCTLNSPMYEDALDVQGIPTMITWGHGGREVFVEGSWDNWMTKYHEPDFVPKLYLLR